MIIELLTIETNNLRDTQASS